MRRGLPAVPFRVAGLFGRAASWRRVRRLHPATLLILAGGLLAVLVATSTVLLVWNLRDHSIAETERDLTGLSTVLADQADRAAQAIELVEQAVIDRMHDDGIASEAEYIAQMSSPAVQRELVQRVAALPQVNAVTLIDRDGRLINFTRSWPIPAVNVADRDYFQALRGDPALPRFISQPVSNRGDGSTTIYIARRLSAPDGSFLGLVLGAVSLDYFERLYRQILPAPDYAVSMFRADGVLLARFPRRDPVVGHVFPPALASLAPMPRATAHRVSPLDGQDRLVARNALTHYPIVINVSRTFSAALAGWRRQAMELGGAGLLLELGLLGVVVLGLRELRNQRRLARAEAARSAAEERARGERVLRTQYSRFGTALDNMSQGLCMFDAEARLVVANRQFAAIFGLPDPPPPGSTFARMARLLARGRLLRREETQGVLREIRRLVAFGEPAHVGWDLADGRALSLHLRPMPTGGWLMTVEDVTRQRQAQAHIVFLANHDPLTRLPNRALFQERLGQAVERARAGTGCAVLCLDLDHFKEVNDTLGHAAGDLLLQMVAARLRACVPEEDTVARLGADEFAVIQTLVLPPDAGAAEAATLLAMRLIEALTPPFKLNGREVTVGVRLGIAVAPTDATEAEALRRNADIALTGAKADGTGCFRFFEPEMNRLVQARRTLEADLRRALEDGEFELFYQPLLRIATREVVGFEALLRWRHPTRGLVLPGEFVPLAEETGLIVPIGEWVLATACAEAVGWLEQLNVAVNLSPVQVRHRGLAAALGMALARSGLAPSRLELEITETVLLQDTVETLAILRQIKALGVTIAMDDFGTGFSSLSYLRRFPFSKVKIDRSFVQDLGRCDEATAIVRAIIGLCADLGMSTLAEGVEREDQLAILGGEHCADAQGYLFGQPRPSSMVQEMLRQSPDGRLPARAAPDGRQLVQASGV